MNYSPSSITLPIKTKTNLETVIQIHHGNEICRNFNIRINIIGVIQNNNRVFRKEHCSTQPFRIR